MRQLIPRPALIIVVALIVIGGILIAIGSEVAGFFLGGLGAVLLAGLVFYAVGRSEDVERENEAQRRRPR